MSDDKSTRDASIHKIPAKVLTVDPRLLEILVCPMTQSSLEYDKQTQELISRKAGLAFPLRDGIPIMIVEEARRLEN